MLPIFYSAKDEAKFDTYLYQYVVDEYKRAPALFIENVAQNSWRFWLQGRTRAATVMNTIITVPLLMFAAFGVFLSFRRRFDFALVLLFVTAYYLAHLPLIAFAKYYIPIIPFLTIFASVAIARPLASFVTQWKGKVRSPGHA